MNQVKTYPVPKNAVLQNDYIIKVRPVGEEEWQEIQAYQVKVDMHDVRLASMAYFDFNGKVEVEVSFPGYYYIYKAQIRPLSLNIEPEIERKSIRFVLDKPANLAIEINKERYHNLHLFAGAIEEAPDKNAENTLVVKGSLDRDGFIGDGINAALEKMPEGRTLYVESGIYYIGECMWHLPSHTNIYLEGGAILIGGLAFENGEDLHISGRGMLYMADFKRFSSMNGIRLNHSKNITLENLMFINPPHYTVSLGDCENVTIRNIKSFSCEGWSDGIDMMSCRDVTVDGGFLRTSDDCVAIYASRWDNYGDARNIKVSNLVLWADVAHATNIGTHGNHIGDGDTIENVVFENIDILEHHEYQAGYLGALSINVGDKNLAKNITYKNIRIEPFLHGKVLDFQVKYNKDYNPAPGRGIENVVLDGIYITSGDGEETSVIQGYNEEFRVRDVKISNWYRDGKKAENWDELGVQIGEYADDIALQ